ncbi:MAG TPA: ATP-binding protein, partial [Rhodocyclaceae bacterium]|nr:ATP-binding protein [Rhodocyclaceae bacterium]
DALRYQQPAIEESHAVIAIEGEWPRIFANRDEMLRLIQNLLDNALKYRIDGQTPEIAIASRFDMDEWVLSIRDNGVGLLPGQELRLFKIFERLQPRSRYPGDGIGLALCRKIVERHHGRIWVASAGENRGCTFFVALPSNAAAHQ